MTAANIVARRGKMKAIFAKKRGAFYLLSAPANRHA